MANGIATLYTKQYGCYVIRPFKPKPFIIYFRSVYQCIFALSIYIYTKLVQCIVNHSVF